MKTTDERLDNGIRVLTGERADTGSVVVAVNVSVGSLDELREEQWGAAHFLEHMAFKGTRMRSRIDIVREVEGRGGIINAQTSHDGTLYYIVTTPRHFEHAVNVLHDVLFHSTFPEDEFEKERNVVLEEIKQSDDAPFSVLWRAFDAEMFRGTARAHPILGTKSTVGALSRDGLIEFRSHYLNDTITVVAVGNIESGADGCLADMFSSADRTGKRGVILQDGATLFERRRVSSPSKFDQCYQFVGVEALNDYGVYATPAATVAAVLLGSGMSSLLFQRVREELGIAYQVGAFLDSNLHNGTFVAYAVTDPDNADRVSVETVSMINRVSAGDFRHSELDEAKERVIGPMYTGSETNFSMACKLISSSIATGRFIDLKERELRYRSVSREDVVSFIRELFGRPMLEIRLVPQTKEPKS